MIARGVDVSSFETPVIRFNNDSGSNYSNQRVQFNGTSVTAAELISGNSANAGFLPGTGAALASGFGVSEITIYGYASTTWKKTLQWNSFAPIATSSGNMIWRPGAGLWNSTAAINRIQIFGSSTANLVTGSQLRIYGRL